MEPAHIWTCLDVTQDCLIGGGGTSASLVDETILDTHDKDDLWLKVTVMDRLLSVWKQACC